MSAISYFSPKTSTFPGDVYPIDRTRNIAEKDRILSGGHELFALRESHHTSILKKVLDFWKPKSLSFQDSLENLAKKFRKNGDLVELDRKLGQLLKEHFVNFPIPEEARTKKNKKFLEIKLLKILMNHKLQSTPFILEICQKVCHNYSQFLTDSYQVIDQDLRTDKEFCLMFDLDPRNPIKNLEILGDETHDRGRLPLLVHFRNHQKIIFKPRSMIVEASILGKEESYFSKLQLKEFTYAVYDKNGWGYCEFLENKEEENFFETPDQVREFLSQYVTLEKILHPFGISDLHSSNIIVRNKVPFIIDAEVIAPVENGAYETGLLTGLTAGYLFTSESQNRIWLSDELLQSFEDGARIKENDFSPMETINAFYALDVWSDTIGSGLASSEKTEESKLLKKTKKALSTHLHRLVLITTQDLVSLLKMPIEMGFEDFMKLLNEGLLDWGFEINPNKVSDIKEAFIQDIKNNDVPVFYFQPSSNQAYYHGQIIGSKTEN